MSRFWPVIALVLAASLILACGSSNRQLQSITIHSTATSEQIQFVATGTFSAAPTTMSPLAVSWSYAPPPAAYTVTTQPFSFNCQQPESPGPIVACAPANPNAPTSGSFENTEMVCNSGPITCPEENSTAQLKNP